MDSLNWILHCLVKQTRYILEMSSSVCWCLQIVLSYIGHAIENVPRHSVNVIGGTDTTAAWCHRKTTRHENENKGFWATIASKIQNSVYCNSGRDKKNNKYIRVVGSPIFPLDIYFLENPNAECLSTLFMIKILSKKKILLVIVYCYQHCHSDLQPSRRATFSFYI